MNWHDVNILTHFEANWRGRRDWQSAGTFGLAIMLSERHTTLLSISPIRPSNLLALVDISITGYSHLGVLIT